MWVQTKRSWIRTVALGGFALPRIWPRTLTVTAIATIATVIYEEVPQLHYALTATPFALVGLPLGIFLGFRNTSAYDRFWEGRKLWGSLVNTSRSLTRQILTLLEPSGDEEPAAPEDIRAFQVDVVHLLIAYVHALRHSLRHTSPAEMLVEVVGAVEAERFKTEDNVPYGILQRMAERFVEARRKGWLHPFHVPVLEASLTLLTDIQGGCERIKSTPTPFSYTVLMHRIVAVYCMFLPFGLMDAIRWATPFVVLAVSYCFFGLDAIGDELEQPFGMDTNDLPLKAISRTIDRNLRGRLGEELPPPVAPKGGILM